MNFPEKNAPAIQAMDLTRRFKDLTAVDRLNLEVRKGEIFGIVGPDGAGKTTTLRMLAGIMDPSEGRAAIAGMDTRTQAAGVKEHLAYMSQRFGLYPDLTVLENISFYADLYGVPRTGRGPRFAELLGFSNMQPFQQRKAGDLSGGMKQKLQLICALIHTPSVLLLDEPTNGVDPISRRDFWRILYRIVKQGVSILVSTAYMDEAERCDRIGLLDRGRLMAVGAPSDIRQMVKGRMISIQSPEARKINRLLRDGLERAEVNVFGDTVHIISEDTKTARDRAEALIMARNLPILRIREALPGLEDVMIHLMEKNTRTDDPGPAGDNGRISFTGSSGVTVAPGSSPAGNGTPEGAAVVVEGLTRTFGRFTAVDAIDFSVPGGQIFGFLGPNGAGKSTTIRMLCGLLTPSAGKGTVAGYDIFTQPERIKQHIGYMSQKFSLYDDLTVAENIDFYGGIYGLRGRAMADRKAWAMDMAGLSGHDRAPTRTLSAGWKQRLALACAILHEPPIVFLDEPTSGVDPLSRRRFWDMIYDMAEQGVTVFVTTHYMEEAEYCDRLALIYHGRIIALGTPMELKTRHMTDAALPGMEDVFIALIEAEDRNGATSSTPGGRS